MHSKIDFKNIQSATFQEIAVGPNMRLEATDNAIPFNPDNI